MGKKTLEVNRKANAKYRASEKGKATRKAKHQERQAKHRQRTHAAKTGLGGRCLMSTMGLCLLKDPTRYELLEFDHIDRNSKAHKTDVVSNASSSDAVFWRRVSCCQLLCVACHRIRTLNERHWKDKALTSAD